MSQGGLIGKKEKLNFELITCISILVFWRTESESVCK